MKIRYRGKKLGWRLYLRKGAIQIDLVGRSKNKGFPVAQVAAWDDSQKAFLSIQQFLIKGEYCCASGKDSFEGGLLTNEDYYFVNKELIHKCNNPRTCDATKRYIKELKKK